MKIGFDLDGIFIGLPPFLPSWVIETLYRDRDHKKLHYRLPGSLEQYIRILSHNHFFRPAQRKNIAFIRELAHKKGYSLFLISSRFGFLQEITNQILKRYGIDAIFQKMYLNYDNEQPHIFKDKVIKKEKISLFVDDDLYLLKFLARENKKITFFWYNSDRKDKIMENLFAITDLAQMIG